MAGPDSPGETLFAAAGRAAAAAAAPLAVRMRPRTLDEVLGQGHLLGAGSPLRRMVVGEGSTSLLLWGPPGTGKTTLAMLVAAAGGRRFRELSAVSAGVKDVRAIIDEAREALGWNGTRTVLFVDEVHRFSRTQQDALLPAVEQGWVTLVAATTENPSFSVVGPLLSRSLLLTLQPLGPEDLRGLISRAVVDERGLAGEVTLAPDTVEHLLRIAGGDARRALTALEEGAGAALAEAGPNATLPVLFNLATLERAVDRAAVRYDRAGDQHYDVLSAFIKSIRGGDVDAGLHYLARMLEAGEDPRLVARRLVILASEDIGLADPSSLLTAVAAADALALVGLPEAKLSLAQAVIHLALAPKSNAVMRAYTAAAADLGAGLAGPVPVHLRDAHYPGAARMGHGAGYRYPHDDPVGAAGQRYAPDAIHGRRYYQPAGTEHNRTATEDTETTETGSA